MTEKSATAIDNLDSVRGDRGSNVTSVRLVVADKPLLTAIAIVLALAVAYMQHLQHESDQKSIGEFSQWADLTYSREVQVQAELMAHGVPMQKFGPIPKPPKRGDQ